MILLNGSAIFAANQYSEDLQEFNDTILDKDEYECPIIHTHFYLLIISWTINAWNLPLFWVSDHWTLYTCSFLALLFLPFCFICTLFLWGLISDSCDAEISSNTSVSIIRKLRIFCYYTAARGYRARSLIPVQLLWSCWGWSLCVLVHPSVSPL